MAGAGSVSPVPPPDDRGAGTSPGSGPPGPGPFPPELVRFAELFRRGDHWESHEVLEGPWRELGSGFYHGLILYASAFVHLARANAHGVRAQLAKAEGALEPYRPAHLGVDVEALLEAGRRVRDAAAAEEEGWADAVAPPPFPLDPTLLSGEEPELRGPPSG